MNIVKPGSEEVVLSTPLFDMVVLVDQHLAKDQVRKCLIHKRRNVVIESQWSNADNKPISVLTPAVFDDVREVLQMADRQISDLEKELDKYKVMCESYRITLDTLRKNGVID